MEGNRGTHAMLRGSHHKEGAVAVDSTDRSLVAEKAQDPVAEGQREVHCCSLGIRMVGVGVNLGVDAECWERHWGKVSRRWGVEVGLHTQVDHNSLAGVGKAHSEDVEGCSIQAIGLDSHVV